MIDIDYGRVKIQDSAQLKVFSASASEARRLANDG
jgi:hypothetical protein